MTTCVEVVHRDAWFYSSSCTRKAGFGPNAQYCKQHALRYEKTKATEIWYRTSSWSFTLTEIPVISATDKMLIIKPEGQQGHPRREKIDTEHYKHWRTRAEAVEYLRKRLESKREQLAKAEAEFSRIEGGQ